MNALKDKDMQISSAMQTESLIQDLHQIIEQARNHVAGTANYALTMMYWHIGERINRDVLGNQRAEYGKQIVSQVATQLTWSHFIETLPIKDDIARDFYITMAASERWGRDKLRKEDKVVTW